MILPTKRLDENRSLVVIGAEIIQLLNEPKTVSRLWEEIKLKRTERLGSSSLTYDWFVLALDFLFLVNTIKLDRGKIFKVEK
jgi:hypothetical protein